MSLAIAAIVLAILATPFLVYVTCWYLKERNETRLADWEFGKIWPARPLRVDLPYLQPGSYHRAARHVVRSGPLFPVDLPGPEMLPTVADAIGAGEPVERWTGELCDMCGRAGPHSFRDWSREHAAWMAEQVAEAARFAGTHGLATAWAGNYELADAA